MKLFSSSTISPPACQKNGMNVCHEPWPPGCRLMPHFAPASFWAWASSFSSSQFAGASLKPPSSAMSVR